MHRFKTRLTPAFRHKETGEIVLTPGIHNIYSLPEVADAPDDRVRAVIREWEAGFADDEGNFWDSEKTHRTFGVDESQELLRRGVLR